jgi:hypothetical protein
VCRDGSSKIAVQGLIFVAHPLYIHTTVCRDTLEQWYDWQAHAQLRQSFSTPGRTKRSTTIFAVAFAWMRQVVDKREHLELQWAWNVRQRSPGRGIAVYRHHGTGEW